MRAGQQAHQQQGTPPKPLPPIRLKLPDGQLLTGRLIRRWQTTTGTWAYRVGITAWGSSARTGTDALEAFVLELDVPASHVQPIPGVAYTAVPSLRARPPEPPAPPTPPPSAPAGAAEPTWIVERCQPGPGRHGLLMLVHAPDCWNIRGPLGATLGTDDAKRVANGVEGGACDVCTAAKILMPAATT